MRWVVVGDRGSAAVKVPDAVAWWAQPAPVMSGRVAHTLPHPTSSEARSERQCAVDGGRRLMRGHASPHTHAPRRGLGAPGHLTASTACQ